MWIYIIIFLKAGGISILCQLNNYEIFIIFNKHRSFDEVLVKRNDIFLFYFVYFIVMVHYKSDQKYNK